MDAEPCKTPIKSMRAKCIDCQGHKLSEVRRCQSFDCPLWPYRRGKRPSKDDLAFLKSRKLMTMK